LLHLLTMWKLQAVSSITLLYAAVFINQAESFAFTKTLFQTKASALTKATATTTVLFPHSFGAYDASQSSVNAKSWTPSQAAEFVVCHVGEHRQTGMQLSPMVFNWSGEDLGEFLSRLFLGEVSEEDGKISYCPSNVRSPMWLGLDEEGVEALKELLMGALPDAVLSPEALSRCAQSFLLREYRWPVEVNAETMGSNLVEYESDSFASRGYSANFAKIIGFVRKERLGEFTAQDVVGMLSLPEHDPKDQGYTKLPEFFTSLGISLTSTEKVQIVEQLALAGWSPSNLAKFVCSIDELEEGVVRKSVPSVAPSVVEGTTTKSVSSTATSSVAQIDSLPSSFVPLGPTSSVAEVTVNSNPLL